MSKTTTTKTATTKTRTKPLRLRKPKLARSQKTETRATKIIVKAMFNPEDTHFIDSKGRRVLKPGGPKKTDADFRRLYKNKQVIEEETMLEEVGAGALRCQIEWGCLRKTNVPGLYQITAHAARSYNMPVNVRLVTGLIAQLPE